MPATRLIINADDLGLTAGINRAIFELYHAGALSSATLMANGPAFEDAALLAQSFSGGASPLGIGCHIVLVDGQPLSRPETVPTLLDPASPKHQPRFRKSLAGFARAALLGHLSPIEIEREATAQITRVLEAGISPTHLDTHKHAHIFPAVLDPLLRAALRLGVPAVRNPFEQPWSLGLGAGSLLRRTEIRLLNLFESHFLRKLGAPGCGLRTTDGAAGVAATGSLDQSSLTAILDQVPAGGTWEIVCHPGHHDSALGRANTRLLHQREVELHALRAVVPGYLASHAGTALVSFAELPSPLAHSSATSLA